jgi:hypothetical protein
MITETSCCYAVDALAAPCHGVTAARAAQRRRGTRRELGGWLVAEPEASGRSSDQIGNLRLVRDPRSPSEAVAVLLSTCFRCRPSSEASRETALSRSRQCQHPHCWPVLVRAWPPIHANATCLAGEAIVRFEIAK